MPKTGGTSSTRRATLDDVARKANVSVSAVSRTFTPGASVSKKTEQRVLKAAKEVGFQPNVLARSLATGRSHMIALVTNAFANPFINSVVDVFTAELQRRKLLPLVFNLKGDFDLDHAVNLMLQYQVDGVIVASSTVSEEFLEKIHVAEIPLIQAFGRYLGSREIDSVFVDNVGGGRKAAQEMLARGYRKPGFVGVSSSVSTTRDRFAGFVETLSDRGISPKIIRSDGYSYASGYALTVQLFEKYPDLDFVFCADDLLGLGALDALRFEIGRSVPDVGVIGFNDIQAARWASHPLATFHADTGRVVLNAIDMLTARVRGDAKSGEQRIVNCNFVERASVRSKTG
ncbi:MAG: LacI family transcriptional regulator [Hyphomonas sp.]|nr:LacI family transcriptional regulator [Hyphomonas sp.]